MKQPPSPSRRSAGRAGDRRPPGAVRAERPAPTPVGSVPRKPPPRKRVVRNGPSPRLAGSSPKPVRIGVVHPERRVRFLLLTGLFVLSLFAAQLFRLQALDSSVMASAALKTRLSITPVPALRGDITASNGVALATSIERRNVFADQTAVPTYKKKVNGVRTKVGVAGAAADLAPLLAKPAAELTPAMTGVRRFRYLAKDLSLSDWSKVSALGIPGIYSEPATKRSYPTSTAAASLVGWVSGDGAAGGGLELLLNKQLQGKPGASSYEQSRDGRIISTAGQQITPAVPGLDVRLTIDSDLQWFAQNAIAQKVNETQALSGTVVVMNVRTGKLAAVASYPTFDPNDIGKAGGNLTNNAFVEAFEPGSIAKVMTAAAALEERVATPATPVIVPNRLARSDQKFKDSHEHGIERLTFAGVMAQSSNIGTVLVGEKVPPSTLERYFRSFGVGKASGIRFPGETPGIFAKAQDWNGSQRYTVMYGQGLSMNAIQSAGVFQTIANGGVRLPPTLVDATGNADGTLTQTPPTSSVRVVSKPTAAKLSQMLEFVVGDEGTARQAKIPGYRVAGKTGTADRIGASGRYEGKTASFVGYAPADKPEFVVAVILQNPVRGYFGGATAGPVFKDVMTYALQKFGIPPTGAPPPVMKLKIEDAPTSAADAETALKTNSRPEPPSPTR